MSEYAKSPLLKMTPAEFDDYMCKTYPELCVERHLPMSKTCLCWGFEIGRGWWPVLDELSYLLTMLIKDYGIEVHYTQVKSKLGSARFYVGGGCKKDVDQVKAGRAWDIVWALVDHYETKTEQICADTGVHYYDKITMGGWIYDICEEAFLARFPQRKDDLERVKKDRDLDRDITFNLYNVKTEDKVKLLETIKQMTKQKGW